MIKIVGSFLVGAVSVTLFLWYSASSLMFSERVSPFGMEETVARIQQNLQNAGNG